MNEETLNKILEWIDTKPMYWGYPNDFDSKSTCGINDEELITFVKTLLK